MTKIVNVNVPRPGGPPDSDSPNPGQPNSEPAPGNPPQPGQPNPEPVPGNPPKS